MSPNTVGYLKHREGCFYLKISKSYSIAHSSSSSSGSTAQNGCWSSQSLYSILTVLSVTSDRGGLVVRSRLGSGGFQVPTPIPLKIRLVYRPVLLLIYVEG
ncbi:hypothetical protein AVEN_199737-1 [Araneus ventricosus]|uniref:Uncharacterized protein n=1 Tax=Araneus ventricosus TaxID=182803 RepID=A0A4Y2LK32_ARAVE|nr:hypothetical protein AVEN_199737-1 [Araneus ventricosus]